MHIISWNVNGIRSVIKKGFFEWLQKEQPDILCLQETKIHEDDIPSTFKEIPGYFTYWHSGKKKGYSCVATFSKISPLTVQHGIGNSKFDDEGRVLITEYPQFILLNCYFPNSGQTQERLGYKLDFNAYVLAYCNNLVKGGKKVLICGDFNVAHEEIDLKNPKSNHNTSGFLPQERAWMTEFLKQGYVDTFRHFHHGEEDHYSWWSYRFSARERNIGWRVDYHCVSRNLLSAVKKTSILKDVRGADHCPVGVELEF